MLGLLKKVLKKPVSVRHSWEEQPKKYTDMVDFLNWFDATTSIEDTLSRAKRDWAFRFARFDEYKRVRKGSSLEVGFGGGRLVLNAAKEFKHAYGVDIHMRFDMSQKFLDTQGCMNFTLLHRDELGGIPAGSIDFVYSFIVFQHFDTFEEVQYYLDHIKRVMSPEGYAHIYFGVNREKGIKLTSEKDFELRECSLFIEPKLMTELLAKDFEVIEVKERLPKNPETGEGESGQFYIVFKLKS